MFRPHRGVVVLLFAGALLASLSLAAQDDKPSKEKKSSKRKNDLPTMPKYFSKLELTPEQEKQVRSFQAEARKKTDPLEADIKELRRQLKAKTNELDSLENDLKSEVRKILTDEQRKKLDRIESELAPPKKKAKKDKDA